MKLKEQTKRKSENFSFRPKRNELRQVISLQLSRLPQPDQIDTAVSFGPTGSNDTTASFRPTSFIHTTVSFGPNGSTGFEPAQIAS